MPDPLSWVLLSSIPGVAIWLGVWVSGRPGTIVTVLGIAGWSLAWAYVPLTAQPRLGDPLKPIFFGLGLLLMLAGGALSGSAGWRIHPVIGWDQIDPTELVTTGPYGLVRHPIYAGCVLLYLGWSLVWGATYAVFLSPSCTYRCALRPGWRSASGWDQSSGLPLRSIRPKCRPSSRPWLWLGLIVLGMVTIAAAIGVPTPG